MAVPVIIGTGLAGMAAALSLAPKPVVLLGYKSGSCMSSSEMAQGGIAAVVARDDNLLLHEQDTLNAGAGLCDPRAVRSIIEAGPKAIEKLMLWGVSFDRSRNHELKVGLEGAHSRRRIVHANGDSTGNSVMKVLAARIAATPSIQFIDETNVSHIETDGNRVTAVTFFNVHTRVQQRIATDQVVLATGSACALWRHTTVPHASWGHGLLLGAQAGACLRDLEMIQFHPTALDVGLDPMPLISEALRGEGARLLNEKKEQFVDELTARDVVARAIWGELERGGRVYLDARGVAPMRERFPTILEACLKGGIDPREDLVPIRPVSHYTMGGIATDLEGRSSVKGLYACGEVASTGLHGANRLASNSLLEAVVMGCRVGEALRANVGNAEKAMITQLQTIDDQQDTPEDIARVRSLMMAHAGMRRSQKGMDEAMNSLNHLAGGCLRARIGRLVISAALARTESRGAHERKDYPDLDPTQAFPLEIRLDGERIDVAYNREAQRQ